MKGLFDVMKTGLEDYFVKVIVPESKKNNPKESRKTNFGLSHREHLGLVILSFLLRFLNGTENYVPAKNEHDDDFDGCVANTENNFYIPVQQVYVYEGDWDQKVMDGIKDVLTKKKNKGDNYAFGSVLLIFCNAEGELNLSSMEGEFRNSPFESIVLIGPAGLTPFDYHIILAKNESKIVNNIFRMSINGDNGVCTIDPK